MSKETIVMCTSDYILLQGLNLPHGREWELLGTMLRRKLHDAVVAFPDDMEPEVVRIGSRVVFSAATGTETRVLTAGDGPGSRSAMLPLRSTRGLALLGARAGQTLCVPVQNGGIETLQLLEVVQDAAAGGTTPAGRATAIDDDANHRVVPFLSRRAAAVPAIDPGGDEPGPSAA